MYIKINNSLIEPSQIVFVALLYFLVEYISIKVMERMVKKMAIIEVKGLGKKYKGNAFLFFRKCYFYD